MNATLPFILSATALLAVPGPTNVLLAASGAAIGMRRSLGLIPVAIAGYLIAVTCLIVAIQPVAAAHPAIPIASKLVASAYLAWTAVRLWRDGGAVLTAIPTPATPTRMFLTTLLNPKALIFAFVIFPQTDLAQLASNSAIFAALAAVVGTGWVALGSLIAHSAPGVATPGYISRVAAVALALFAALMASSAVAALT